MDLIGIGWMEVPVKPIDEPKPTTTQIFSSNLLHEAVDIRKVFHQFLNHFPPHLSWTTFHQDGLLAAEVLMSAELIYLSVPTITMNQAEKNDPIPPEIRPDMRKFRMEIVFEGVRNASKQLHSSLGRYKVELTMGDLRLFSGFLGKTYKTNSNFIDPYASGYLLLPEQFQFWPPLIIKHLDFSHKNPIVVGTAMIRRPEKFFVNDKPKEMQRFLLNKNADVEAQKSQEVFEIEESEPLLGASNISQCRRKLQQVWSKWKLSLLLRGSGEVNQTHPMSLENEHTWWTKFYNANREENFKNDCLHELTVGFDFHPLSNFIAISSVDFQQRT